MVFSIAVTWFHGANGWKCTMCGNCGKSKCFAIFPELGFGGYRCCEWCYDLITNNILPPYKIGDEIIYSIGVPSLSIDNDGSDYLNNQSEIKIVKSIANYSKNGSHPNTFSMKLKEGECCVKFLLQQIKTHGEKTFDAYLLYTSKL